ncbi:STAS domain-containing protein [Candidatus Sumerlaeota bacterium]|nr:STAS domain-containing protein [Candidatus Sumerlaeota bacterium]
MAQTQCDLQAESADGVTVFHITGRITAPALPMIRDRISQAISRSGHRGVIVDMAGVDFIDSSVIGFLISTLKILRGAGQDLGLTGLNTMSLETLRVTSLAHILPIFASLEEARQSMGD